ncbi:MAG: ATP phosphoribosyltransferase [bacterium]|nr:ATP phosphoribosyltransferase [bacterium]
MENENKLKLGLPKGSLEERTVELFKTAGFDVRVDGRSYYPKIDDPEIACVLIRAQEIPRYVESGVIDAGITGQDLILESKASVVEVVDLGYTKGKLGKTKLVLAVPENSNIKSVKDLAGKTVATEFVEITKDYLRKNKVAARVEFSWGATEIKPPHLADAIVELTDTGTTLRAHNLKIIDTLMESSAQFIANQKAWRNRWKREKIKNLVMLLKGALAAEEMVGVFMHVPRKNFKEVLKILPAMVRPTITKITGTNLYDFFIVSKKEKIRELIPRLKKAGCTGIIEFPLNKVIQ